MTLGQRKEKSSATKCVGYGFRKEKNINEEHHKRTTSSETTINRTPGLPRSVDAADVLDVDGADEVDEVEVPLRAIAMSWNAVKLRADVSSELIAL